jgi:hypothetical protein
MKRPKKQKSSPTPRHKQAAKAKPARMRRATAPDDGPVTLEQAKAMVQTRAPRHAIRRQAGAVPAASPRRAAEERKRLQEEQLREERRRISEYTATMDIMKDRGVKGLASKERRIVKRRAPGAPLALAANQPLQIFAQGDSWFDYPVPLFGGGIIPRLEKKLGVPILNLAKAGDEVRFMLGVAERKILVKQLAEGCPAGGPWDALLFSGGGNDIVANPMALWVRDYAHGVPAQALIHQPRFSSALALVLAGYEDLIALRDSLSPSTHLMFHAYDFAIPDGRGICFMGPWMKPTFDLHKFPDATSIRFDVVKDMLSQFAAMVQALTSHQGVTFINGQGTLVPSPSSWHNELHPAKAGFDKFAGLFHTKLKALFPTRVL